MWLTYPRHFCCLRLTYFLYRAVRDLVAEWYVHTYYHLHAMAIGLHLYVHRLIVRMKMMTMMRSIPAAGQNGRRLPVLDLVCCCSTNPLTHVPLGHSLTASSNHQASSLVVRTLLALRFRRGCLWGPTRPHLRQEAPPAQTEGRCLRW